MFMSQTQDKGGILGLHGGHVGGQYNNNYIFKEFA